MLSAAVIGKKDAIAEMVSAISAVAVDEIMINSRLDSVSKGIEFLENCPRPDIIFSTIELNDGLSFDILNHGNVFTPVIFFAEDDYHLNEMLDYNCVAILPKLAGPERLRRALTKYWMMLNYFANSHSLSNQELVSHRHAKSRMIVKNGKETVALPINDIVLFHTGHHRCVHVKDRHGNEYITDKNLCDIEAELDKEKFFRVSRQYIVNIDFIHGFKSYERVKLLVELTVPELKQNVVVSQEMAPQFREWIYNA